MKQVCKFNSASDILATQQGLASSIPDALDYGRIKDTSCPSSYNGQKKTDEVGVRVSEPFDVIEFDRSYTRIRKTIKDSEYKKSQEKEKETK